MRIIAPVVIALLLGSGILLGADAQSLATGSGSGFERVLTAGKSRVTSGALDLPARLTVEDIPLHQALSILQSSTSIPLIFSPTLLPDVKVTCLCASRTVGEALEQILRGLGFQFTDRGGQVVISVRRPDLQTLEGLRSVRPNLAGGSVTHEEEDMLQQLRRNGLGLVMAGVVATAMPISAQAQNGQIVGTVVDQETAEPLVAVQVFLQGTSRGTLTGAGGDFSMTDVPPGSHTVVAQRIGYQEAREAGVNVISGTSSTVRLSMRPTVLMMQGIVATGLVDPVEGARSPISIARVSREMMPVVVAGSALQNLQGRMAGVSINRSSGRPGDEVTMQLRTPTSMSGATSPMIVVDGVILGSSSVNVAAEDIESMEVIRGAAAASLYGSRAAAGVIAITTSRGRQLAPGQTQFQARMEMGRSEAHAPNVFPMHHQFLVDDPANPTTYVNAAGAPVDRARRVAPPAHLAFMDKPFPGPTYNNVKNAFGGGDFSKQNLSVMHNAESTNLAFLLSRMYESGALLNNDGYELSSIRINLDHRFMEGLSLGVSAFHSRDKRDEIEGLSNFTNLYRAPRDIDLTKKDENGEYLRIPDSLVAYENPLWIIGSREGERKRARTLGSANLKWDPYYWLTVGGNVSFDRQDGTIRQYTPKGTPLSISQNIPSDGSLAFESEVRDTWNGEAQASLRRDFGALNIRTTFRALLERDQFNSTTASGSDFFVYDVPRLDATANRNSGSVEESIRSEGYLWDTAFDYDAKYILTALARRDGSSLFGPDNRWHNYYRVAGAWRLAEEPWFNVPDVNEFKLSYARGTAGGRPPFQAQYETWTASASGVSKGTLGNRNLRPEHTTEQELSLDMILWDRLGIDLTYAWQRTTDQILNNPLPQTTGYRTQWMNGGTVVGDTWELTLESQVTPQWTTQFVFDRSKSNIEEWPFPCQAPSFRLWCAGSGMYEIFSSYHVETYDQLRTTRGGALAGYEDQFMVNDDGWMVWVGAGNRYTDGIAKGLWGTSTNINGEVFSWGMPFFDRDEKLSAIRASTGTADRVNLGWTNNFRLGGLNVHAHLQAGVGGMIGRVYRDLYLTNDHPFMDQVGTKVPKPDELKKPIAYYHALEGGSGNRAHQSRQDFIRLGTLSLNYNLTQEQLSRIGFGRLGLGSVKGVTAGIVGRDLLLITNCFCADPQQGVQLDGARDLTLGTGIGAYYPTARTFTLEFGVTF